MKDHKVDVFLNEKPVGTLAETAEHRVAFAYADSWLENGFAISPFSLPLEQKVFVPTSESFQGLWGVFADSLPDTWGRLLVDRMLRSRGYTAADVSVLDRLAIVGSSGMGALTYRPAWDLSRDTSLGDLDELASQCAALLQHEENADLDALFRLGGSSGGARPKVMTDAWIIKFPASGDMMDTGVMEKEYMDCAADCGITVPETKLMPSRQCAGYFASSQRFYPEATRPIFSKCTDACVSMCTHTTGMIMPRILPGSMIRCMIAGILPRHMTLPGVQRTLESTPPPWMVTDGIPAIRS